MDVDAVEQRPAHLGAVGAHALRRAGAAVPRAAEVTARARIHRAHEQRARRERGLGAGAGDGDHAVLQRLAQGLQRGPPELRKLVEEEYAMVREAHLARPRPVASTHEAHLAHRVVRGAEGASAREAPGREEACHAVDGRDLERLVGGQRRQEARQAAREHRLARAGRADHQEVVPRPRTRPRCARHRCSPPGPARPPDPRRRSPRAGSPSGSARGSGSRPARAPRTSASEPATRTSTPSTSAASAAIGAAGTMARRTPSARVRRGAGEARPAAAGASPPARAHRRRARPRAPRAREHPHAGGGDPSRARGPADAVAVASARSNPLPALGTSAGARLTTTWHSAEPARAPPAQERALHPHAALANGDGLGQADEREVRGTAARSLPPLRHGRGEPGGRRGWR